MNSKPSLVERLTVKAKVMGRIARAKRRKIVDKLIAVSRSLGKTDLRLHDRLYFNHQGLEISCTKYCARLLDEANAYDGNYRALREYYKISGRPGHPADAELARDGGINCSNIGAAYQGEPVFAVFNDGHMACNNGLMFEEGKFIIAIYKPGEWENVLEQLYRREKVQKDLLQIGERKKERKKESREEILDYVNRTIQSLKANFCLHPPKNT